MNYRRGNQIKDGGEGKILYVQGRSDLLMKIYKDKNAQGKPIFTPELQIKLKYMIDNPPTSLISQGVIAWPLDFVIEQGNVVGFIMPKLIFNASLQSISAYKHPIIDQKNYNDLPAVKSRIGIAINLASTLSELHRVGYIVGDLNHDNIGINKGNAQINVVDCDSFHIIDRNGHTMRTNVVMEGYLAPEIIAHCNNERSQGRLYEIDNVALPTFSKYSDLFCLAVHIFKLLMNGVHPFLGVKENATGSNATPFVGHEGVERNNYVLKSGLRPSAVYCLASNEIPQEIVSMFNRTFVDGHTDPSKRSTAEEWYKSLSDFMSKLKQCANNQKHQYYNILSYCPYCEADKKHLAAQQGQVIPIKISTQGTGGGSSIGLGSGMQVNPPQKPDWWKSKWVKGAGIAAAILTVIWLFWPKSKTATPVAPASENSAVVTPIAAPSSGNSTAITSNSAKGENFTINQIEFGNVDEKGNIIDSYGSTLYASTIKYLKPMIRFTNASSASLSTPLSVKVINPDGTLNRGQSSPENYTFTTNINIGGNKIETIAISGWGNENGGVYNAGTYTYEIWKDEKKVYSTAVTLHSDNNMTAADYNRRGDAYYYKYQYDHAIKDFDRAINLNQNYADAYYNRGWAYLDSGKYQQALNDFNKTISLNSQYVKAYNGRGRAYEKLGNLQQALEAFDKAISLDKNYTDAKNNRDRIYNQLYPGPKNLRAGTPGTERVTLTWDSAGEGVSYIVYWGSERENASVPSAAITGTSATITGMSAGTTYSFSVSAVRNGKESAKSSSIRVQTAAR